MTEPEYDIITGEPISGTPEEVAADKRKVIVPEQDPNAGKESDEGTYDIITGDKLTSEEIKAVEEREAKDSAAVKNQPEIDAVTGEEIKTEPLLSENSEEKQAKSSSTMDDIISALKGMVSFFTIIRIPVDMKEFDAMERNFWLAPAVGLLVGFVAFIVCAILGYCGMSPLATGAFALASAYLFSKFLHFDGLTDFGDGMICSSGSRDKHVKALKDTLVGAGGVGVAIITVLITVLLYTELGWRAVYYLGNHGECFCVGLFAFAAEILVKYAQVSAAVFGEPGNGMASRQVSCTTVDSLIKSSILTAVLMLVWFLVYVICCKVGNANIYIFETLGLIVLGMLSAVASGWWMARTANRNFGFVNGDILGATNEISRVVILLICCIAMGLAGAY